MMNQEFLLSINISLGNYVDFVTKIALLAKSRTSSYVCVANVHMCIEAHRDATFAKVVNGADIVTPDGMPLVKGLKANGIQQSRVAGPDLMPSLLEVSAQEGLKVYFYGSTDEVLQKLNSYCQYTYPTLSIAGMYSPPFRQLSEAEIQYDIDTINNSGANMVLVALGCPKQERWMASMKGKINAVMIGVGGAFPMLVGEQKRAPLWMQKYTLEWLYRLIQEPKRLWKRYLITNTYFVVLFTWSKMRTLSR
jgi:N-acetylglucosaminyldiphosphoundecaprenol N-acetyl-beta-D-mannosaminyltransferase